MTTPKGSLKALNTYASIGKINHPLPMGMGVIPSLKKAAFCSTVGHSPYRSARSNNSKSMHKRAESSNVARFEDVRS